jgi:hypothetical protein
MPTPYMMIGGFVLFVVLIASTGGMLGVIINRTGC